MGLAEKRASQEFQTKLFPGLKKRIDEAAGFDVKVNVDWASLAQDGVSHLYNEGYEKVYFSPLIGALKQVGQDDMGRAALKTGLKEVVVVNKSGFYSPNSAITFAAGVLTIDHEPTSNIDDAADRQKKIVEVLEAGL